MKIAYVSNFMNHHQLPLSQAILRQENVEYNFISLEPIHEERLKMGYEDMNHKYPFVICAYDSEKVMKKAIRLIDEADIAIYGSCPDSLIMRRASKGKLCVKFSERYFRRGLSLRYIPHNVASAWKHLKPFEKLPLYFCCSSAFTSADLNRYTRFENRAFKWGYFPEVKQYDIETLMNQKVSAKTKGWKHPSASILWVGRLIGWKHPDAAIQIAAKLKENGYTFKLKIIGNGDMEETLNEMIHSNNLADCVEMLGSMPPEEVRKYMEEADIYLFTSDFNEGWGAVLNESMNSGCAVVASHAIGSVPFLIKDGENGLIYKNGDIHDLCEKVEKLLNDSNYRYKLGQNAYKTMIEHWNADVAARRFVNLAQKLLLKENVLNLYPEGPCSQAELLQNGWYDKK